MLLRFAVTLALGLALAGCAALGRLDTVTEQIEQVTQPVPLYVLSSTSTFDADLPEIDAQLVIEEPIAASHLDTDRIAIMPAPLRVEYFPEARWADRAPRVVQRLLVESFENTDRLAAVSGHRVGLASDFLLFADLRDFQAVTSPAPGQPVAVRFRLNLKIVEDDTGLMIASESFSREMPAASAETLDVVAAFDEAVGAAMGDAVEWTIRRIGAWEPAEDPYPYPPEA